MALNYYSPDKPGQVQIADFFSIWFRGLFFTLSGALLFGLEHIRV